jgi:hypothetical protein
MKELAWPIVGLILGLVLIFVFRRHLGGLLDRVSKLKVAGFEASAASQETAFSASSSSS